MRRLESLVLALIVAVWSAATSSPHVHAYGGGHDHAEHQHGPASHNHHAFHAETPDDDGHGQAHGRAVADDHDHDGDREPSHREPSDHGPRFEACDPGAHVLTLMRVAAPRPQVQIQPAVLPALTIMYAPVFRGGLPIAPLDVRVHGPPPDSRLPARAPPSPSLA